jgi:aldehyde oxidoreductase
MKVLERRPATPPAPITCPRPTSKPIAVYTNNVPCGAMRGFGVNQAIFGLESCVDELCEQGGFDRWQFRYDNACRTAT